MKFQKGNANQFTSSWLCESMVCGLDFVLATLLAPPLKLLTSISGKGKKNGPRNPSIDIPDLNAEIEEPLVFEPAKSGNYPTRLRSSSFSRRRRAIGMSPHSAYRKVSALAICGQLGIQR